MNIELIPLQVHGDSRGSLIALEDHKNVPFDIRRIYYVFGTLSGVSRGFHAHKALRQMVIPVRGSCQFLLDDGVNRVTVELNDPTSGLMVEKMIWHEMHNFSDDCVLVVLADAHYDESDYIRNYDDFRKLVGG
ncbi:FdtA/QdtA family cupin domain-containing protein [Limnobacter sp.]|uniref:sugar 3,4-ketoisomerase n=1 Tax=Limnobacter sp. TaxID=2003368 RepID=UPI0027B995EB|nr:FdtA/QdtA family cupin domain-containing protein [Limnobacter sp.]